MLNFERFRATNAAGLSFDLKLRKRGLVRMLGPNGAGKSTLWHMFTQAHYGASPNGAKKSDFQHEEKIKDFLIESTFSKNNATYTAAHAVKSKILCPNGDPYGSGVFLFRDGVNISQHRDPDTLNLIKQTMGWSLDEWYGYVYLAQATTHSLINGTRSTRQSYLSALFNLLPLDVLHKYCKTKSDSYDDGIKELEREKQEHAIKLGYLAASVMTRPEEAIQELRESIAFIEQQLQKLAIEQARYDRKKQILSQLAQKTRPEESREELETKISQLQQQQAAYRNGISRKQKLDAELQALPTVIDPTLPEDFESVLASPDQNAASLRKEIGELLELSGKIKALTPIEFPADYEEILASPDIDEFMIRQRLRKLQERPAPPTVDRPEEEKLNALRHKVAGIFVEITSAKKKIRQLELGESECDKCGTVLDVQHRKEELEEAKQELTTLEQAYQKFQVQLTTMTANNNTWAKYDQLGPDETHEIPVLQDSIERFKSKKVYQGLAAQQKAYEEMQINQKKVERLPELQAALALYDRKGACLRLQQQKENYARFVENKSRLEADLKEIVLGVSVEADILANQKALDLLKEIEALEEEIEGIGSAKDQSAKIQGLRDQQAEDQGKLGQMTSALAEVKRLTEEVERLRVSIEQKKDLEQAKLRYNILAKGYGKAGQLRELQLKKFSNYLREALLAHTIRQLPEHRFQINVDDGIDILTSKNGCTPYDVKFMSGGEQGALSLAFLFALDDLLPPDRRTNLKIVDEIEAAFDKDRKQDFAQHTLPELRNRAETVIVISHAGAANQGIFDSFWEIKDGGILERSPERREYEAEEA